MADALQLVMMTFPQLWDGKGTLTLNVLLVPSDQVDPIGAPLIGADPATPSFANGAPTFSVHVQPALTALPSVTGPGVFEVAPVITSDPASPLATFTLLQGAVTTAGKTIGPVPPPVVTPRIRKALPPSYLAAGGAPPDGNLTTTDADFACEVDSGPLPVPPPPRSSRSWGEIISYALRQPVLATRMGLRYALSVTLADAHKDALAAGGWVFISLADTDPWAKAATVAGTGTILVHAARIPPLDAQARPVFATNEFTVDGGPGSLDTEFSTAETYADGFAKLVHCTQPTNTDAAAGTGDLAPASDLGIQIGWDDAQVVTWYNDQLALLAARRAGPLTGTRAPLGVLGYRIDVADVTPATPGGTPPPPTWQSLTKITTTLPAPLGDFTGELDIEPAPARPSSTAGGDAWLPRYFANWRGGSLCEPDATPEALASGQPPPPPARTAAGLTTMLSYGRTYAFRVRLADLSSGGPPPEAAPVDAPPNAVATQTFRRFVPPKAPIVVQQPPAPANGGIPSSLVISRPLIGYPEVLFTRLGDAEASRDTMRTALVAAAAAAVTAIKDHTAIGPQIAGLPDPDVDSVEIEVAIRHPLHDLPVGGGAGGVFQTLYRATRALTPTTGAGPIQTDPGTTVPLAYVDAPNILGWSATQAATGPLLIPRGRDVRILVRAQLRAAVPAEPDYFAPEATPTMATTIAVRCEPLAEAPLLEQADNNQPITAYLFRRPPDVAAPALVDQLAELLGVAANGNSLTTTPGRRVVFGASKALRHTIAADGETLTFGSAGDLLGRWVIAIILDLQRDWTWDGLADAGFNIVRGGPGDAEAGLPSVGALTVPRVLGATATTSPSELERGRTRLVFLDAIDPHEPVPGLFPESLQHRWYVQPTLTPAGPALDPTASSPVLGPNPPPPPGGTDFADQPLDIRVPIAVPPDQVPAIASVGLAQSPFQVGPAYASTLPRRRALWVELTAPIANQAGDALFARVLAHGADPILYNAQPLRVADSNPPLPLDPELVRVVVPADTDDRAGINAMTQLIPSSTSPVHFLLPLPPGVAADDPDLFGFYSYEFRVGHAGALGDLRWWSTANARFGSPLRVVGVQHPPPPLVCRAGRFSHQATSLPILVQQLRETGVVPFPLHAVIASALDTQPAPVAAQPLATEAAPPASGGVASTITGSVAASEAVASTIAGSVGAEGVAASAAAIVQSVRPDVASALASGAGATGRSVASHLASSVASDLAHAVAAVAASATARPVAGNMASAAGSELAQRIGSAAGIAFTPVVTPVTPVGLVNPVGPVTPGVTPVTPVTPVGGFNVGGLPIVPAVPSIIIASAPYATPVLNGAPLVTPFQPPKTSLWFFVYGQVVQADGASIRNVLLATSLGIFLNPRRGDVATNLAPLLQNWLKVSNQRDRIGIAVFTQAELTTLLQAVHLPESTPLSVLAVELLPPGTGTEVGHTDANQNLTATFAATTTAAAVAGTVNHNAVFPFGRILRASPLTPVGPLC